MHSRLTVILAEQHIADLHRAADKHRLAHTAATTTTSHAVPGSRPAPPASVTLIRRLRRHLAPTHPAAR
jgi:hypothetical protein